MNSAGGAGAGDPLIAGTPRPDAELHEFSDGEFAISNYLDLSDCPDADALQSLHTVKSDSQKRFLAPQTLTTGPLPDSPNGSSYHDSSSESAGSTKRNGSTSSEKTAVKTVDGIMDDGNDINMDWGHPQFSGFGDDDNAFTFGQDHDPVGAGSLFTFGGDADDAFMDQSFDFDSASASPENQDGISPQNMSVSSPEAAAPINTQPAKKRVQKSQPKNANGHKKRNSQFSVSSAMNGLKTSGSREVSPLTNAVTSQGSSPGHFFTTSPGMGFPNGMNGAHHSFPGSLNAAANILPQEMPRAMQFNGGMVPNGLVPAHMPLINQPQIPHTGPPELRILPTPSKSRVETQIPIKMTLSYLPPGVTKLHLPAHTISKPKLLAKPRATRSPEILELHVSLYCTSSISTPELTQRALERAAQHPQGYLPDSDDEEYTPQKGYEVRICNGCVTRERKRAARKKIKKPEEEELWKKDEHRRVVVFNTHEIKDWQPYAGFVDPTGRSEQMAPSSVMQVDAPMRIACYCRHHGEKMGFNVVFTIKDYQDRVVAQAMSHPIMITDDHKTHPMAQLTASQQPSAAPSTASAKSPLPLDTSNLGLPSAPPGFRMSQSSSDLATLQRNSQAAFQAQASKETSPSATSHALSRPASPSSNGPQAKKRKASGSKVPDGLAMTRLDGSPTPNAQASYPQSTGSTSPFTPNPNQFPQLSQVLGQVNGHSAFTTGPSTPTTEQPAFISGRTSMDNASMTQLYSAPASNHPSRAPSPSGLRTENSMAPQNQFAQALANSLYSLPPANPMRTPPMIHKIIPNEGPMIGGIEVTVLGAAFFQGLEVWFGENKATTTTFWGESSLVCLLPPSPVAGPVPVKFKHQSATPSQSFAMAKQPPIFRYVEDNEDKLIRTALSVIGHKMSGHMLDISDLARAILNNDHPGAWSGGSSGGMQSGGGPSFNQAAHEHLEPQLLKCLDLIDLDDSTHRTRLDLKRPTGHTMLHLACSLGYHRLVAALLARGANPDARDKGGFTSLHMAALYDQPEIVRRLILAGADPTIRSLSSLRPADVAQSRAVLRAIRRSERHVRSRSGSSLHSRTSSATSLRSLWEPLSKINTHDEPIVSVDSGEESPEYTSGDFEEEEEEESDESSFISMRRSSAMRQDSEQARLLRRATGDIDDDDAGSPAAVAAAFKDHLQQQFQQFQHSMAMHFQNLPQIPQMQMPNFSGMPMLPDSYQAYFQPPPFMRRVQQWMPAMPSPRPSSADGGQPKLDHRWWDLSYYMNTGATPPPAYDDIFPAGDADRKQASAAQAAAEAEADIKCAALYDQGEGESSTASTVKTELPSILKIGRKNAITKEQQEQFLRAREAKLKRLSSDRNLFFIWIPLLIVMICAMIYSYFPAFFPLVFASIRALAHAGRSTVTRVVQEIPDRVVEV